MTKVGSEQDLRITQDGVHVSLTLAYALHNHRGMRAYTSWLLRLPTDAERERAIAAR